MAAKFNFEVSKRDMFMVDVNNIIADHETNGRYGKADTSNIRQSFLERIERGEHPQINPVLVRPNEDKTAFVLIAGFGRYTELCWLNREHFDNNPDRRIKVKCVLSDSSDNDRFLTNVEENLCRNDLTHTDIAYNLNKLTEVFDWTQQRIAKHFNKSQSWVSMHLTLWKMSDEIKAQVHSGELKLAEALEMREDKRVRRASNVVAVVSPNKEVVKTDGTSATDELINSITMFDGDESNQEDAPVVATSPSSTRVAVDPVDKAIASGRVPARGADQPEEEYRAEIAKLLEEDAAERAEEKKKKAANKSANPKLDEFREFCKEFSLKDYHAALIASAIDRYFEGEFTLEQLYRAMVENARKGNGKLEHIGE